MSQENNGLRTGVDYMVAVKIPRVDRSAAIAETMARIAQLGCPVPGTDINPQMSDIHTELG